MIPAIMPSYGQPELAFERGEGLNLYTTDGRRFLDFGGGIAVTLLGHSHPHLVQALVGQAEKLWHTSNLYRIPQQERLADRLVASLQALIAQEGNPLDEISKREVEKIFTGDIERWTSINGKPGSISIYTRNTSSGTYAVFQEMALRKRDYATSSQKMAGNEQIASEERTSSVMQIVKE